MELEIWLRLVPSLAVLVVFAGLVWVVDRIIQERMDPGATRSMIKGMIVLFLALFAVITFVLMLPVSASMRENILKVGGLVLTGVLAFSSTTIIRDAAAGTAMRFFSPFKRGDYLEAGEHFGRVTEVGLMHTELQTRDRSLVTLSNAALLSDSFTTIPSSGSVISTTVSLGYDVSHRRIEEAMLEAAASVGLEDAFVHVLELNDFSVTYRAAGLLEDIDHLLTKRSDFRRAVLDHLHEAGIEIVSPLFQNQRRYAEDRQFIPSPSATGTGGVPSGSHTEEVVFAKALEAKKAEDIQEMINQLNERLETLQEASGDERVEREIERMQVRLEALKDRKQAVEEEIKQDEESAESGEDEAESTVEDQPGEETSEVVLFEKALEAEGAEKLTAHIDELQARKEELQSGDGEAPGEEIDSIEQKLEVLRERKQQLEEDLNQKD